MTEPSPNHRENCPNCGLKISQSIARATSAHHHHNGTCPLCQPPEGSREHPKRSAKVWKILFVLLAAFIGILLQNCSYKRIAELRKIGRIPQTTVAAVVPGEVNITGRANPSALGDGLLKAPDSGKPCLYYFYEKEREETDSDGDKTWVTVESRTEFVPFDLKDSTGLIRVEPDDKVDFNVEQSHRRESLGYRYTEHRIDPNGRVFVLGFLKEDTDKGQVVQFHQEGDYHPIISEKTEHGERSSRAIGSIWLCWFGMGLIGLTVALIFSFLGHHRILVFFALLSLITGIILAGLGLRMMTTDIKKSLARVHRQEIVVRDIIQKDLAKHGVSWNGNWKELGNISDYKEVPAPVRKRLRRIRIDLASASRRTNTQTGSFPYNIVRDFTSTKQANEIPLTKRDEELLAQINSKFKTAKVSNLTSYIGIPIALIVGLISLFIGFRKVRHKRMVENLPTTASAGLAYGLSEVKGLIDLPDTQSPLNAPLSGVNCIAYDYTVREKRGSGKSSRWVTIHEDAQRTPFLCTDREGSVPVDPSGAKLDTWRETTRQEGRRVHTENRLQLGDPVYIMAHAKLDPETGDRLYLANHSDKESWANAPFLISGFHENHILRKGGLKSALVLTVTFSAALLAGLLIFGTFGTFNPASYLAAALISPLLMALIAIVVHYNDLVFLRERARRNWSNIDVSLKKRNDLIPKLNEVASAALNHEKELQTHLADLRTNRQKSPEQAQNLGADLSNSHQTVQKIIALREAYPNLGANEPLSILTQELTHCENEIAFMSAGYNDAVETYNTRIASFPDILLAKPFGFKPMELLGSEISIIKTHSQ